jgi:hypothetical protein
LNWARALTFSKNRPHRTITYEHARNELTEHHHEPEKATKARAHRPEDE